MPHRISLSALYHTFFFWLERRLGAPNWLWKLTFVSVAISIFLAFPAYSLLYGHLNGLNVIDAWAFIEIQSHDLLHPTKVDVYIRRENMIFRWFLPVLSWLTGHNIVLILVIQAVLGILFIYLSAKLYFSFSKDKVQTALFTLAIANLLVGSFGFVDVIGYGDGFACFFLLVCLVTRQPILFSLSLLTSFLVDERALMTAGFVCLWWITKEYLALKDRRDGFGRFFTATLKSPAWLVVVCWVVYLSGRTYVRLRYFPDHGYSTLGTPVLLADAHRFGFGSSLWTAFEGMWLLIGAAFLLLWCSGNRFLLLALVIGMLVLIVSVVFIHDIDR
ncbi:hypothetical protein, partial [Persicitalea sp.]|uniref:hypothetical protein n=1 Tax=Persicitalea sp. TaxID=3100273 RepID=UPI003592EE4E